MATSQNGYTALQSDSILLMTWKIRTKYGMVKLRMLKGPVGFVLAHLAGWIGDTVEKIPSARLDDWAYAYRPIRGDDDLSNHSSGTAIDINATQHPLGVRGTWSRWQKLKITAALKYVYKGCIEWGENWRRPDGMHFEAARGRAAFIVVAKVLVKGDRGKRLLADNNLTADKVTR